MKTHSEYRAELREKGLFHNLPIIEEMTNTDIACDNCGTEMQFDLWPSVELMTSNPYQIHIRCDCGENSSMFVKCKT